MLSVDHDHRKKEKKGKKLSEKEKENRIVRDVYCNVEKLLILSDNSIINICVLNRPKLVLISLNK